MPRAAKDDARRRLRHRDRRRRGGRRRRAARRSTSDCWRAAERRAAPARQRAAAGARAAGRAGRRLGARRPDRRSGSAPARSPGCGSGWPRRGRSPRRSTSRWCRWGPWRRWRAGSRSGAGQRPARAWRSSTRAAARCSPPSTGRTGEELWPPLVAAPGELAGRVAALPEPPLAAGSGALRFRGELEAAGAEVLPDDEPAHRVSARHVCVLAEAGRPARPESIEPIYLRPPDAELWLERDTH